MYSGFCQSASCSLSGILFPSSTGESRESGMTLISMPSLPTASGTAQSRVTRLLDVVTYKEHTASRLGR